MNCSLLFITGTDTGVGKTLLGCLLARALRERGVAAAALKPVCSGDRRDARLLRAASENALALEEINPWHFQAPLAPRLAARRERISLRLASVTAHVRRMQRRFPAVIVEGAGGLLSPLGKDFDSRDLILALDATPIVVCPNRLGAINQSRLALAALPPGVARRAQVVLMAPAHPDEASRSNGPLLAEMIRPARVHLLPRLKRPEKPGRAPVDRRITRAIGGLLRSIGRAG